MSDQESTPPASGAARPSRIAAALPFVITAVAAVLISLGLQALLWPSAAPPTAQINTITPAATSPAPAASATSAPPPASPVPTPREGDVGVLRLDILDLEAENDRLWSAIYLLRAASQLDDAVAALLTNDLAEADRTIMTARRSLDRAYALSAEQDKGPIDSFRIQTSQIRDDLRVRPEGADRRLRQLRQLVLALVDEGTEG